MASTSAGRNAKDIYKQASAEYDSDYKVNAKAQGYGAENEVNMYNKAEDRDIGTPLDGEALTREIGGTKLTSELYDRRLGAGFKDRRDL